MEHETYLDCDDAWLFALTRQKRAERKAALLAAIPQPVRYAAPAPVSTPGRRRRVEAMGAWKNAQWAAGVKWCGYCGVRMTRNTSQPRTCTVDHRQALACDGDDDETNWILACSACNQRKGLMSESTFRTILAVEARGGHIDSATVRPDAPAST